MVCILLSTYNGEKYLEEQLQSLIAQEGVDIHILVRDDGSIDNTTTILDHWQERKLLTWYTGENLRPEKSFMHLLFNAPQTDYYAFCDQDDVWLPQKLQKTLQKMKEVEERYPDRPVIVHTDMYIVDGHLNKIHPSFWKYSRLRPDILNTYFYLAICNGTNGCTMLLNNKAREVIREHYFIQNLLLHDVLCSLIVSAHGGVIEYVNEPTMLYRQHEANVVGAKLISTSAFSQKLLALNKIISENKERLCILNQIKKINGFSYWYYKLKYLLIRIYA